ncbi:unnamed protein product, partial [Prorocentrum cordatum]
SLARRGAERRAGGGAAAEGWSTGRRDARGRGRLPGGHHRQIHQGPAGGRQRHVLLMVQRQQVRDGRSSWRCGRALGHVAGDGPQRG